MKKHALSAFRKPPEHLNCAQSVLYGYQQITGDKKFTLADLKQFSGGRAPGGLCGAVYAACLIVPESANDLKNQFEKNIGSTLCKQIRSARKYSCETCVAHASEFLEKKFQHSPGPVNNAV